MFKFVLVATTLALASAVPSLDVMKTMFEDFTVKVGTGWSLAFSPTDAVPLKWLSFFYNGLYACSCSITRRTRPRRSTMCVSESSRTI